MASANFSSTRISCRTDSAIAAPSPRSADLESAVSPIFNRLRVVPAELFESEASAVPATHQTNPPTSNPVTAAAAPPSVAAGDDSGLGGNCHKRRSAGRKTFNARNATMIIRNAPPPFGNRSAAHTSNVQAKIQPMLLNQVLSVHQP